MPEKMIDDARDLLERFSLTEIGTFEAQGLRGRVEDGRRKIVGPGRSDDLEITEQDNTLGVFWLGEGGQLLIRLSFQLETTNGTIRAGVQGEWATGDIGMEDITPEAEEEWINKVAVMALIPYLRTAISDLSVRVLGLPLTLPIIRQGELEFSSGRVVETENV